MMIDSALSSTSPPSLLSSLAGNTQVVGTIWILSSAILTTYSTTKFLIYQPPSSSSNSSLLKKQQKLLSSTAHESSNKTTQKVIISSPAAGGQKLPTTTTSSSSTRPLLPHMLLSILPRSGLLTLYRFSGSMFLGYALMNPQDWIQRIQQTFHSIPFFVLPASCLFIANWANAIALQRIGISLTYTSKCGIPLVTVLLTWLLQGQQALPGIPSLLSLLPIALGIAAASWNTPSFHFGGMMAAVISCVAQAMLNVSCKRALETTGLNGPQAQRAMVVIGLALTLTVIAIQTGVASSQRQQEQQQEESTPSLPPSWLGALAASSYHFEYLLSFIFCQLVSPISYGACDAVRRLCIILAGRIIFASTAKPLSRLNISGIALALLGALSYSITNSSSNNKLPKP